MEQKTDELLENIIGMEHVEFLLEKYTKRQLAEQIILYHNDMVLAKIEELEQ